MAKHVSPIKIHHQLIRVYGDRILRVQHARWWGCQSHNVNTSATVTRKNLAYKLEFKLYMLVQGAQIYKKSTSHLQILGARRVREASFILWTNNSAVLCGRHCYLALSAGYVSTDTHTFVWDGENYNIYAENMCHCRKFGCLEFVHPSAY